MIKSVIGVTAAFLLLVAGVHAEVLFGPVPVGGAQTHTGTFGMYCRCTAYFLEARNQGAESCAVFLNGTPVLELSPEMTVSSTQVELLETEPNEIEITVGGPSESGVTVEVYERDVTPAPLPARQYTKLRDRLERFGEAFVLNHWADRFKLKVVNGDEYGDHRVTSGSVLINNAEVISDSELNGGAYIIEKEIELDHDLVRNSVKLSVQGDPGSKIQIGIEEAAQTVTVTEVAEVELPFFTDMGGIQMHNGEPLLRLSDPISLVEIDGQGSLQVLLSGANVRDGGAEGMGVMSMRGSYVWTSAFEDGEPVSRFYDRDWNLLSEVRGERRSIQQISEAGNVFMGWDEETYTLPTCAGKMAAIYNATGSLVSKVPISFHPSDLDLHNQLSPDGLNCWIYCNDRFQLYGTDGTYYWEALWRRSRELANGRMAVQGTADSLIVHGSEGQVVRRLVNPRPANKVGLSRTTPDGQYALHKGHAVMVAKRAGPQSCWSFDPGGSHWVTDSWLSDDGKWILAIAYGFPPQPFQSAWLLGAGGQIAWHISGFDVSTTQETMLTQHGEYFYLLEEMEGYNERCLLFNVVVE